MTHNSCFPPAGGNLTTPPSPLLESEHSSDPSEFSRFEHHKVLESSSVQTRGSTAQKSSATRQLKFLFDRSILKSQLADRLLRIDSEHPDGLALRQCHEEAYRATCNSCSTTRVFWNRCERRFCPICAQRLARERKQQLVFWLARLKHAKFLTLTLKNVASIDADYMAMVKDRFKKLRRSKLFNRVSSGFWSMEVTNQGNGFHVHLHVLFEGPFLEQRDIEAKWSKLIGQDKSIVHIKAAKGNDVLDELVKYTAKPTEMVNWPERDLIAYLNVITDLKMFGVFGKLHGLRSEWKELIEVIRAESSMCDCGCNDWKVDRVVDPPKCVHFKVRAGPQISLFQEFENLTNHLLALT